MFRKKWGSYCKVNHLYIATPSVYILCCELYIVQLVRGSGMCTFISAHRPTIQRQFFFWFYDQHYISAQR